MSEHLTETALAEAVNLAWSRLFAGRLRPAGPASQELFSVSAQLQLAGMESTVLVVRASQEAAIAAAVGLLDLQDGEVASGDIADAFADIVVAIGCAVRTLLAGLTKLETPVVVQGSGLQTAIPGAHLLCETNLKNSAGPVTVSLWRPRTARRPLR